MIIKNIKSAEELFKKCIEDELINRDYSFNLETDVDSYLILLDSKYCTGSRLEFGKYTIFFEITYQNNE